MRTFTRPGDSNGWGWVPFDYIRKVEMCNVLLVTYGTHGTYRRRDDGKIHSMIIEGGAVGTALALQSKTKDGTILRQILKVGTLNDRLRAVLYYCNRSQKSAAELKEHFGYDDADAELFAENPAMATFFQEEALGLITAATVSLQLHQCPYLPPV